MEIAYVEIPISNYLFQPSNLEGKRRKTVGFINAIYGKWEFASPHRALSLLQTLPR
jgi:hypothetical protein